jgi:ABC-type polysaccharide transport system permease subunit
MASNRFNKITNRIYRSIPLMPVFLSLYLVILFLSPLFLESGCIYYYIASNFGLSLVSAYSTTLFFDGYLDNSSK